jgi:cell division protein FtsQ
MALAWSALSWLVRQPIFSFHRVVVTSPLMRANPAHVQAAIRNELHGTFFTMDLDRSRRALMRVPWVRKVSLRRQWPHGLEVAIEEHVALARWNDCALMNVEGELFTGDYNGELPQFRGPDNRALEVLRRYREWSPVLAGLSLDLQDLDLSPRGGWHLETIGDAGPLSIELGRDDPDARFARFLANYGRTVAALRRGGTKIEHVDLRYRNGFAVKLPSFKERAVKKLG